jgi:hypothetical protein
VQLDIDSLPVVRSIAQTAVRFSSSRCLAGTFLKLPMNFRRQALSLGLFQLVKQPKWAGWGGVDSRFRPIP